MNLGGVNQDTGDKPGDCGYRKPTGTEASQVHERGGRGWQPDGPFCPLRVAKE